MSWLSIIVCFEYWRLNHKTQNTAANVQKNTQICKQISVFLFIKEN
jgi:hypothetical protein